MSEAWLAQEEVRELMSNYLKYRTLWIFRYGSEAGFSEWLAMQLYAAWRAA
jgi:hypothetical protein